MADHIYPAQLPDCATREYDQSVEIQDTSFCKAMSRGSESSPSVKEAERLSLIPLSPLYSEIMSLLMVTFFDSLHHPATLSNTT